MSGTGSTISAKTWEYEMGDNDMNHMRYLEEVCNRDVQNLTYKEKTYQGSWKKRGGIGAAMMMLRKIDRIEVMLKNGNYDIFTICGADPNMIGEDGTLLAEIRDLRRYLILIESEIMSRCVETSPKLHGNFASTYTGPLSTYMGPGTPEDGGHHARQEIKD
jgi:hypothetical protein